MFSGGATVIPTIQEKPESSNSHMGPLGITIYVDDDNTEGPWDGTLEHPYQFIQDGIDNANDGDYLFVFNGTYFENIIIYHSITVRGESRYTTIIDGENDGSVVQITTEDVTLREFTIKNCGTNPHNAGISVNTEENSISKNIIKDNNIGIRVLEPQNTIVLNNFYNNELHAWSNTNNIWNNTPPCGGNFWENFNGVDDDEDGILDNPYNITGDGNNDWRPLLHPYGSIQNIDTSEEFLTIQHAIQDGDTHNDHTLIVKADTYYEHVVIYKSLNLIGEDAPIITGRGTGDVVKITDDAVTICGFLIQGSGVEFCNAGIIITTYHNHITENIIEDNYHGIIIRAASDFNNITNNIIRDNQWNGLYIKPDCNQNIIIENIIENNEYAGIAIDDASYNTIFHNSFFENRHHAYDNANNVWDDDYPSGGNYWDDYTGVDENSDGIGDTPYPISDGINEDRYPLMHPYEAGDSNPPEVEIINPQNGVYLRNLRLFSFLLRQRTLIFGTITIQASAFDVESGIDHVEFYIDDDPNPKGIDEEEPYEWVWKRGSFLKHRHTILVVAFDNAGNYDVDAMTVRKFF
jgi:parallel beta-helix repeat protein